MSDSTPQRTDDSVKAACAHLEQAAVHLRELLVHDATIEAHMALDEIAAALTVFEYHPAECVCENCQAEHYLARLRAKRCR